MKDESRSGGFFLLQAPESVFCPERFSEQQRLVAQTAERFAQEEIAPHAERIETKDFEFTRSLLRQAGELGLCGVEAPEEYGGMGMDLTASAIVADHLAVLGSFSVSFGAHSGIGTLPLVYFGSDAQKKRYLPRLASGEWVGAYALSEAESGSDALALRTRAEPEADGQSYVLNGEKMWISNAGFADLFTIFARAPQGVTAFLVEAASAGLETGAEEHKMGIEGSSTRALLLRDVRVPAENVLGELGGGAKVAFRILNAGRFKLGAACIGGARNCLRTMVSYAKQRHAFGKPISEFGLVRQMIADGALGLFASETAVYRTAALLQSEADLEGMGIECALIKVEASEMLDRVVDRAVQIHGGNGFMRGNPAERAYRDARVNRIFEGTNEINRLLMTGLLLKQAQAGKLPLAEALGELRAELLAGPQPMAPEEQARKATLLVAGAAFERFGEALAREEEMLAAIADLLIAVYVMQSVAVRRPGSVLVQVIAAESLDRVERTARRALALAAEGDTLRTQLAWLRRLLRREPVNVLGLRRQIAAEVIEAGG